MTQKVFITKYTLSSGIMECEMEVTMETKSCYGKPEGYSTSTGFHGTDFYLTKEDAVKDCEKRKEDKIISLKKQIVKISKLSFSN